MNAVRKQIFLAVPVDRVWAFLTNPEKIATWLMDSDLEAEEGARFKFSAPASGQWDGKIYCEIKDVIENEHLSYTWNANDIGSETLVTFDLKPDGKGTRLTLTHSQMEDAMAGAAGRHAAGWTNCLKALANALCGTDPAYDWSIIQLTSFIEAPLCDVFAMWTTSKGMASFWADEVKCTSFEGITRPPGGGYQLGDRLEAAFTPGGGASLEVLNIERDNFLLFSFGEDYGWVRVALSEEGGRTRLELRHFGLPDDDRDQWETHVNARGWWAFILENMKSVLLHGHDLRDRRPETAGALGAAFQPGGKPAPEDHDWSQFDIFEWIDASPKEVMRRWQTKPGLESFFIAQVDVAKGDGVARSGAEPFQAGDHYAWRWIHEYAGEGKILDASATEVAFTFGSQFEVNVSASADGSGTLLRLHQSGMADTPEDRVHATLNCRSCWIYFLATLKSQLEHGADLRDKDPVTADAVSVGYNLN